MNEGTVCLSVKKEKSLALFQHLNCSVRKEKVNEHFSMAYLQWAIHNESINDMILNFVFVYRKNNRLTTNNIYAPRYTPT